MCVETLPSTRIIPARAGFTDIHRGRLQGGADHPRSRGVYADRPERAGVRGGSSPLARGLLFMVRISFLRGGIIPARAGFTSVLSVQMSVSWDHPRSRGVYNVIDIHGFERVGSSPLARGLPRLGRITAIPIGIIPARAGFTYFNSVTSRSIRDHPRSRGVYEYACVLHILPGGSSPLARGLRDRRRRSSPTQ